jgi:hypothetical protein
MERFYSPGATLNSGEPTHSYGNLPYNFKLGQTEGGSPKKTEEKRKEEKIEFRMILDWGL